MRFYSDYPARRTGQIVADLIAVAVIATSVTTAALLSGAVAALADVGRRMETAGTDFERDMSELGERLDGVPVIGDGIRGPVEAAGSAGGTLASTGQSQQDLVATLALATALVVALVPIAIVLWVWLRRRVAFARRAEASLRMARAEGGADVLALRALVRLTPEQFAALGGRPVDGWRSGDIRVVADLADLELRHAGVRPPPRAAAQLAHAD